MFWLPFLRWRKRKAVTCRCYDLLNIIYIQGVAEGIANILGGGSIDYSE
jgi:hypothetical protein